MDSLPWPRHLRLRFLKFQFIQRGCRWPCEIPCSDERIHFENPVVRHRSVPELMPALILLALRGLKPPPPSGKEFFRSL